MIKISFKTTKLVNRLNKTSLALKDVDNLIKREAQIVHRNIKSQAPVKSGRLSRSITFRNVTSGSNIGYRVYSKVKYAPYQDFGTGSKFQNRPFNYREFDDYATNFMGHRPANPEVRPRAYFMSNFILGRRNLNREYRKILNYLK